MCSNIHFSVWVLGWKLFFRKNNRSLYWSLRIYNHFRWNFLVFSIAWIRGRMAWLIGHITSGQQLNLWLQKDKNVWKSSKNNEWYENLSQTFLHKTVSAAIIISQFFRTKMRKIIKKSNKINFFRTNLFGSFFQINFNEFLWPNSNKKRCYFEKYFEKFRCGYNYFVQFTYLFPFWHGWQ